MQGNNPACCQCHAHGLSVCHGEWRPMFCASHDRRNLLAKEYIYDPSHSEEQAALFLDAAGTEEWTLEDLRTLAAQSDIDSMKILQRKIEQLHKASQKKK